MWLELDLDLIDAADNKADIKYLVSVQEVDTCLNADCKAIVDISSTLSSTKHHSSDETTSELTRNSEEPFVCTQCNRTSADSSII